MSGEKQLWSHTWDIPVQPEVVTYAEFQTHQAQKMERKSYVCYSKPVVKLLEETFSNSQHICKNTMQELVLKTGLTRSQITAWFQYRRKKFNAALRKEVAPILQVLHDMSIEKDRAEEIKKKMEDESESVTTNQPLPCFGVINQSSVVYPALNNTQLVNIATLYSSHALVNMGTLFVLHSLCDFYKQLPIKSLGLDPTSIEVVNYVKDIESMFNHITDLATTIDNAKILFETRFGHYYAWYKKDMLVDAIAATFVAANSKLTVDKN